jgi:peptide/nickel transport system substrate-binding protein
MTHFPLSILRRSLGTAAVASVLGFAFAIPASGATPRDTLVVAFAFDDIITMDPAEAFEISAGEIMGNVYDRLVRFDVNDPSKLYGDVAKSWNVSADGKTYAFELKPGLKFASGNPLTAEDVVFSLQRAVLLDKTPAFILTQFGFTKENVKDRIKQNGPLTLTIETEKTFAPTFVLNCLTANVARSSTRSSCCRRSRTTTWVTAGSRPITPVPGRSSFASGAPTRSLRSSATTTTTARNRSSRASSTVHVKEAATQRLLLEKADADIARNLTPQDLAALASNKDIKTTSTPKGTVYYFSLNQKNPILAKAEVREAMKWLVDYSAIGDTLIKNIGVVHQNFLPVGLLGASTENPYKLDVDKGEGAARQGRLSQWLQGDRRHAHGAAGAGHHRGIPADCQARGHRRRDPALATASRR